MATNNLSKNQCQGLQTKTFQSQQPSLQQPQSLNYEPLDKSSSNTLKVGCNYLDIMCNSLDIKKVSYFC